VWIDELQRRSDPLDDRARAEMLFTWAVTTCAIGEDDNSLTAAAGIQRLQPVIDDPSLANALNLALSWTLPILDDIAGARTVALSALAGFQQQNDPFAGAAAMTVGMIEMSLGHDEVANSYLREVKSVGDRFNNTWLMSTAGTQLATLAVRGGRFEEARALLADTVNSLEGAHVSTLTVTFALVAFGHLALANGDVRGAATALGAVDGLRKRAGLLAWPLTRRGEADLADRVAQQTEASVLEECLAFGAGFQRSEALALVRNGVSLDHTGIP